MRACARQTFASARVVFCCAPDSTHVEPVPVRNWLATKLKFNEFSAINSCAEFYCNICARRSWMLWFRTKAFDWRPFGHFPSTQFRFNSSLPWTWRRKNGIWPMAMLVMWSRYFVSFAWTPASHVLSVPVCIRCSRHLILFFVPVLFFFRSLVHFISIGGHLMFGCSSSYRKWLKWLLVVSLLLILETPTRIISLWIRVCPVTLDEHARSHAHTHNTNELSVGLSKINCTRAKFPY